MYHKIEYNKIFKFVILNYFINVFYLQFHLRIFTLQAGMESAGYYPQITRKSVVT